MHVSLSVSKVQDKMKKLATFINEIFFHRFFLLIIQTVRDSANAIL